MGSAGNCEHCGTPLFTRAYEALLDAPTYEGSGEYHSAVRCRDKAGRRAERERIVAWLREVSTGASLSASILRKAADDVERGEHLKSGT